MGRRHLIFTTALLTAAVIVSSAAAAGTLSWRELSRGTGTGTGPAAPRGYVAYDRAGTGGFKGVPGAKNAAVGVNFKHDALVAVIGEFGCQDARIAVKSIAESGSSLQVSLAKFALPKGTVECDALFPTYRLLLVAKAELNRPFPSRVVVRLAPA